MKLIYKCDRFGSVYLCLYTHFLRIPHKFVFHLDIVDLVYKNLKKTDFFFVLSNKVINVLRNYTMKRTILK